jgi:hypothetical protein
MPAGLKYVAGGKKATRRHFKGLDIPLNFLYNYEHMLITYISIGGKEESRTLDFAISEW